MLHDVRHVTHCHAAAVIGPFLRTASGHWLFPPVVWVESKSHPTVNSFVTLGTGSLTLLILHSCTHAMQQQHW